MEFLHALDIQLLRLLNVEYASPELDRVWLTLTHLDRQPWFLFILLPLLLLWLVYIYRLSALRMLLVVTIAVGVADLLSYRVVKTLVDRPRPFENSALESWIRQVDDAHGPGFPSNHAANCFAGAVVLAWYFRPRRYYFYALAAIVAISRVALGVHYPSDIIAGALLGATVGYLVRILFLHRSARFQLVRHGSSSDSGTDEWRTRIRRLPED